MIEFSKKVLAAIGTVALGVLAVLLRRRTRELHRSRIEGLDAKHAAHNESREANIAALKSKVDADGKVADTKARLLLSVLDDGRDASSRRK